MPFNHVPNNAMLSIMLASDYKSVLSMKAVSKSWLSLISANQSFWRHKFEMDFGEVGSPDVDFEKEYNLEYGLRFREPRVKELFTLYGSITDVQVFGSLVVSSSWGRIVQVWDLGRMECQHFSELEVIVNSIAIHANNVIAGLDDGQIFVWAFDNSPFGEIWQAHESVQRLRVLDDRLVSLGSDDLVKVWDLKTYECLQTFQVKDTWILRTLSNGEILVDTNNNVQVYHKERGLLYALEINDPTGDACSYSNYIFVGVSNGEIQVWDRETKQQVATFEYGEQVEDRMILKCDARYVISITTRGNGRIWKMGTWTCIRRFHVDVDTIECMDYKQRKLVLGTEDGEVYELHFWG